MDHTVLPANNTILAYLPFLCKRSPDGATTTEAADIHLQLYYSFIDPEGMKG